MKKLRATLSCSVRRRGYDVNKECHWYCYMYTPLFVIGQDNPPPKRHIYIADLNMCQILVFPTAFEGSKGV